MVKVIVYLFPMAGLILLAPGCARDLSQDPRRATPALAPANPAQAANPLPPGAAQSKGPEETEYKKLLDADDEAQAEADKWIRENQDFAAKGGGLPQAEMNRRIRERFEPVRKGYEDFIQRHPEHARARVAFAGFLGDLGEDDAAKAQLERAMALDPNNPAVYNNLANIYGHEGPVKKAFEYFGKALELNPRESVYYHNFATTVYVFRKDAMEYFGIDEQQVIEKSINLYSNALRLDPDNFPVASDVAQTYYAVKPLRADEALNAWTNALRVAHDEVQRQGVLVHMARIKMAAGRFAEAHAHLDNVTDPVYNELKSRLARNLQERERNPSGNATNAPPAAVVGSTNAPPAAIEKK